MVARYAAAEFVLAALVAATGCGFPTHRTTIPNAPTDQLPGRVAPPVNPLPPLTTVAQAVGAHVDVYRAPSATHPDLTLDNPQPSGAPLVFLVQQQQSGWLNVLLPVRPNGSAGWISRRQSRSTNTTIASSSNAKRTASLSTKVPKSSTKNPSGSGPTTPQPRAASTTPRNSYSRRTPTAPTDHTHTDFPGSPTCCAASRAVTASSAFTAPMTQPCSAKTSATAASA